MSEKFGDGEGKLESLDFLRSERKPTKADSLLMGGGGQGA